MEEWCRTLFNYYFMYTEQETDKVTLYEEILVGQPTLFTGSDDTFIYAVNLLNGNVKWKMKTKKDTGFVSFLQICLLKS